MAPSKQTLGEWLDLWLDTYVSNSVKPYTVDSYRSSCRVHIKPVLGNIRLYSLTTLHIQRFYNQLLQDGISPKTIKNINGVLHKALSHATASFTLDIYGHASQKMRQQSADRMEQFIKTVISN